MSLKCAKATAAITGPYHMVRNIHSEVSLRQYQWHLTLAVLMDFWIVLIKAKKMRSKIRHERKTEKMIKIRQGERSKWKQ